MKTRMIGPKSFSASILQGWSWKMLDVCDAFNNGLWTFCYQGPLPIRPQKALISAGGNLFLGGAEGRILVISSCGNRSTGLASRCPTSAITSNTSRLSEQWISLSGLSRLADACEPKRCQVVCSQHLPAFEVRSSKRLSSLAVWSFTFSFGDRCTAGSTRHHWVFIWGCCKSKRFIQQMHPSALQHSTWRQFTEIEWCFSEHKLKILKTQVKAPACSTKCCHEFSYDIEGFGQREVLQFSHKKCKGAAGAASKGSQLNRWFYAYQAQQNLG